MGLISFFGFTLLVASIAWYATRNTDENSSDGYFLDSNCYCRFFTADQSFHRTDYEQVYTEQVHISPWKLVYPVGGLIVAIVIGIYIYFA